MKKTVTINLNGILYTIDEDACELLEKYLFNLKHYFEKEVGADEIVGDMEARISELLSERLQQCTSQIVTIKQVEEIIGQMGNPEEIDNGNDSHNEETGAKVNDEAAERNHEEEENKQEVKKRLYRNPDDKMISGVCSGLAVYFGVRTVGVRIATVLAIFLLPLPIVPIYLILWLCVPLAETATQRLEMYGKRVNLENIGKTVKESFGSNENEREGKEKTDGCLLKGCLFLLLALLLLPLILVFVVMIFVFGLSESMLDWSWGNGMWWLHYGNMPFCTFAKWNLNILIWLMPIVSLVYYVFRKRFNWPEVTQTTQWIYLIVWLLVCMARYYI